MIDLYESLASRPSTVVDHFTIINGLGNALRDRHHRSADPSDLDRAVSWLERAVELAPPGSPQAARLRANLGAARLDRFIAHEDISDLDGAIKDLALAAEATGRMNPDRARVLFAQAVAVRTMYERTDDPARLSTASGLFSEACALGETADTAETVRAADEWGSWSTARQMWTGAAAAFDSAVVSLIALVQTQLRREHKESWLRDSLGLPGRAAYAHSQRGHSREAVMSLELGRGVLLMEALSRSRRQLAALSHTRPDLVARFTQAAHRAQRHEQLDGITSR